MGRRLLAVAIVLNIVIGLAATTQATARRGETPAGEVISLEERSDQAFDLRYRSIGVDGELITQTAVLWLPPGERSGNVVAWGHATAGLADECAPSVAGDAVAPGLERLLAAGHVVVAPDYEGLGSRGIHPYLVGRSEGRSVLDALRAARDASQSSGQSVVYGWSQGGHAAVFAGGMAPSYAPDVRLVGVVGIAPVTDVASLVNGPSFLASMPSVVSTITASYTSVYPELEPGAVLDDPPVQLAAVRSECDPSATLVDTSTRPAPPSWDRRLAENNVGSQRVSVPVLLVQGEGDLIIPTSDTVAAFQSLCGRGTDIRLDRYQGVDHLSVVATSTDSVLDWFEGRFAGEEAVGCAERVIPPTTTA